MRPVVATNVQQLPGLGSSGVGTSKRPNTARAPPRLVASALSDADQPSDSGGILQTGAALAVALTMTVSTPIAAFAEDALPKKVVSDIFKEMDKDGSGFIEISEMPNDIDMENSLLLPGNSNQRAFYDLRNYDTSNDQKLDENELEQGLNKMLFDSTNGVAVASFNEMDKNKDGFVDASEVPGRFRRSYAEFMSKFDSAKDGKIDQNEFAAGFKTITNPQTDEDAKKNLETVSKEEKSYIDNLRKLYSIKARVMKRSAYARTLNNQNNGACVFPRNFFGCDELAKKGTYIPGVSEKYWWENDNMQAILDVFDSDPSAVNKIEQKIAVAADKAYKAVDDVKAGRK